jgi:hypothetical protein
LDSLLFFLVVAGSQPDFFPAPAGGLNENEYPPEFLSPAD